jgi:hypothetical protein
MDGGVVGFGSFFFCSAEGEEGEHVGEGARDQVMVIRGRAVLMGWGWMIPAWRCLTFQALL